ncbi:hypothetical protein ES702_07232 [subsurface metagenome]
MPYKIKHFYSWQGRERDEIQYQPLLPYQIAAGMKESGEQPDLEPLRREEDLAEAGKKAAEQREEEREGIIDIDELRKYRRESWERGGYLDPSILQ